MYVLAKVYIVVRQMRTLERRGGGGGGTRIVGLTHLRIGVRYIYMLLFAFDIIVTIYIPHLEILDIFLLFRTNHSSA